MSMAGYFGTLMILCFLVVCVGFIVDTIRFHNQVNRDIERLERIKAFMENLDNAQNTTSELGVTYQNGKETIQ